MLEAALRMFMRYHEKMRWKHFFIALGVLFGLAIIFSIIIKIGVLTAKPLECIECGNEIVGAGNVAHPTEEGYVCNGCYDFGFN